MEKRSTGDVVARVAGIALLGAMYGFLLAGVALLVYQGARALTRYGTLQAIAVTVVLAVAVYGAIAGARWLWRTAFPPTRAQDKADAELRAELERLTRRSGAAH